MKYTVFNSKFIVIRRKLVYNIAIAKKYKSTAKKYNVAVYLENTICANFYQNGNFTINGNAGRKWQMAGIVRKCQ